MISKSKLLYGITALMLCMVVLIVVGIYTGFAIIDRSRLEHQITQLQLRNRDLITQIANTEKQNSIALEKFNKTADILVVTKERLVKTKEKFDNSQKLIFELSRKVGFLTFNLVPDSIRYEISGQSYQLRKFKTDQLPYGKHGGSVGTSYLEQFGDHLVLASATGIFGYMELSEFQGKRFEMKVIPSNISGVIEYEEFFRFSRYGIKDILLHDGRIYVSYSNQQKPDCYNTSVLVADMNFEKLIFDKFFEPDSCISESNDYGQFNAHHSGGRMALFRDNKILFTHGEYKYRDKAQDLSNPFGKVIAIDLDTASYEIISMGHRNPQGLYYLAEKDMIFLTEHGPQGGDEVNIVAEPGGEVENYGWPISSYGEHYGFKVRDENHKTYQIAPLYKSHSEYGFVEPAIYFTPSIAISEIIAVPERFTGAKLGLFFIGAMGNRPDEGDMSIHAVHFDDQNRAEKSAIISVNERVRDIIYIESLNQVVMFLESTPAIGVLEAVR